MPEKFTLEYWRQDGWYVGRLREKEGIVSTARTVDEVKTNLCEAFNLQPDTTVLYKL